MSFERNFRWLAEYCERANKPFGPDVRLSEIGMSAGHPLVEEFARSANGKEHSRTPVAHSEIKAIISAISEDPTLFQIYERL